MFVALAVAIGSVPGCYSRPGPPSPAEGRFNSFALTVDSTGPAYVIKAQVASPGYTLETDSVWDAYRRKHIFISVRKPDPRFAYPQGDVELNLLTTIDSREPMTVFARVAGHDEKDVEDEYREAVSVKGAAKSAAPPR